MTFAPESLGQDQRRTYRLEEINAKARPELCLVMTYQLSQNAGTESSKPRIRCQREKKGPLKYLR